MLEHPFSIFLILLCLCFEGLFSGGEIALVASDMNRIRQKAEAGSRSAALVLKLLEKPEWFFATTLAGTDLCIITSSVIATSLFISEFGTGRGELFSALLMIPAILIFGEIIPKSLFQQKAESVSMWISWFIVAVSRVLYPIVFVVSRISKGTVSVFMGEKANAHLSYITKEGIKVLLKERGSVLTDVRSSERDMIGRILDFSGETANRIMVPLSNLVALERKTTLREASLLFKSKWFSRIPVYDGEIFNIVGILHGFDLLKVIPEGNGEPVEKFIRTPVFYVPETKRAGELLIEMQKKGEQMAVIVDEYGGSIGILTIEDLLEEIVGEIEDEYDRAEQNYRELGKGRYLFNARTSIEAIRERIRIEIPAGDYETLGGFLLDRMGKIPRKGEMLRYGGAIYLIQDTDPKSIKEVVIIVPHEPVK